MSKAPAMLLEGTSRGLLFWPALRRAVRAAGFRIIPPPFGFAAQGLAVWGRLPASRRRIEAHRGDKPVFTFEDSFLRSVLPGTGSPPVGLTIDDLGVHFEAGAPSRLETILKTAPLDDPDLLQRASDGRAFLQHYGLSKYNPVPRGYGPPPVAGYVLVVDQVAGDAAIAGSLADANRFAEMLDAAIEENPGKTVLVRTHPAVMQNTKKSGHFGQIPESPKVQLLTDPYNPVDLLEGAGKVYCVSSQMGFEAILLGHRPVVFGAPFYAGWGCSDDRHLPADVLARRGRALSPDQMFAAAMLEFSFWYDRTTGKACHFEQAAQQLLAEARHRWSGLTPSVLLGMHMWKHGIVGAFLDGGGHAPVFSKDQAGAVQTARDTEAQIVVWAGREDEVLQQATDENNIPLLRMEDGFLRSTGLGAELTPAVSLVLDDLGIYYNPAHESRLERDISRAANLPDFARIRANDLRAQILERGVTKYNLGARVELPDFPNDRPVILIPGQVEDDASIRTGAGDIKTNLALIAATRAANPDAFLIYKTHPDVLAGLRKGHIPLDKIEQHCDFIADGYSTTHLIGACDSVWTMTSLLGFEALLRDKPVTCFGMPFYAGWGLTDDRGPSCPRRTARPSLEGLIYAALIDYPQYIDPVTGLPCRPELVVDRLAKGQTKMPPALRILAKLQGLFAGYASIWRRGAKRS